MTIDRHLEMLEAHDKQRPVKPKVSRLTNEDTTIAALIKGLNDYSSSTSIVTDEFSYITKNGLLNNPGMLCKTYDGSSISVDRISTGSTRISVPLITLLLMGQPDVISSYIKKHWATLNSTGFIPRLLISSLESTAGDKTFEDAIEPNVEPLNRFYQRISELLNTGGDLMGEGEAPKILHFTPEAEDLWKKYHDLVEKQMKEGEIYARFRAYGSRSADKVARLSALFQHVFLGEGDIEAKTVRNCIKLVDWYTSQYVGIFGFESMTVNEKNVFLLSQWLHDKHYQQNTSWFDRIYIRRFGPSALRKQSLLDAALSELADLGHVSLMRNQYSGQEGVAINSSLFEYVSQENRNNSNMDPLSSL